jgi:activator of HSP90 ATPase
MSKRATAATANTKAPTPKLADGLSHAAESIHQQIPFTVDRRRVYRALTDTQQFDAITRLSEAASLLTAADARPTSISATPGGAFALFGGYVTGQNVELQQDERIVQVWRAASWPAGAYSIASFQLVDVSGGSKLTFDHRGFPDGQGSELANGWHINYWKPMAKFFAQA